MFTRRRLVGAFVANLAFQSGIAVVIVAAGVQAPLWANIPISATGVFITCVILFFWPQPSESTTMAIEA